MERAMRSAGMTAVLVGAAAATLAAAQEIRVAPIARDGRVLVSFALAGAFSDEVTASIRSGLPTTFIYDVDLRRAATVWFDRTIASTRITVTVRYDNLTRRYQVSVAQDGRVEDTRVVDAADAVRRAMTAFERLPLFGTSALEANAEYYVRVRARTRPRDATFFWPWGGEAASGSAPFTFIP
jgi:hypothetical protein